MKEYSSRLHREFVDVVPEQVQVGEEVLEETSMEEHSQLQEAEHKAPELQEAIMMQG